jgi:hypothetical protein
MLKTKRRAPYALAAIPVAVLAALAVFFARPEKAAPVAAAPPPPVPIEAPAPGSPAPPPPAPAPAPAPQVVVVHDGTGGRKAPPKPDCTPPYTLGSDGVKRFKVECLH